MFCVQQMIEWNETIQFKNDLIGARIHGFNEIS